MNLDTAHIRLQNVSIDFLVYNSRNRSLKNQLIKNFSGGIINIDSHGRTVIRSLDDLTLDIEEGDRVAILGHNGSGKTTLLRTIAGVYRPIVGSVSVSGNVFSLLDISLGIDPEATGIENIYLRAAILGISKKEVSKNLAHIIDFSGLGQFIDLPLRTYSSGMNFRLAFSISTLLNPEILLMDEWLSVGDCDFAEKAQARLTDMVNGSKILVIATHSEQLAKRLCNRIITLHQGRIQSIERNQPG
jgi:lipopolysaccharide transport system ATP-binding protein